MKLNIKKSTLVLLVNVRVGNGKAKSKAKTKYKSKLKPKPQAKTQFGLQLAGDIRKKDGKVVCFYYNKSNHWRRHYKTFRANKYKKLDDSSLDIFMIEINLSHVSSWVMDTKCGSNICTNVQDLRYIRLLN